MKRIWMAGMLTAALSVVAANGAQPLLGTTYGIAQYGVIQFGEDEVDDVLGNGSGLRLRGNLPLMESVDLRLEATRTWADGSKDGVSVDAEENQLVVSGVGYLKRDGTCHPFVLAGLGISDSSVEATNAGVHVKDDSTDVIFTGEVGTELTWTDALLTAASLGYDHVDGDGVWFVEVTQHFLLNEHWGLNVGISRDLDGTEDTVLFAGVLIK